jgi:hypothetical protein
MREPNQTTPMGDIPRIPDGFRAEASGQSAQVIQIDNGKAMLVTALCAAICSACLVITIGAVMYASKVESNTQYELRIARNHADDAYNKAEVLRGEVDSLRTQYARLSDDKRR